jgi:hypothetical protein
MTAHVTVSACVEAVAAHYDITATDLLSARRTRKLARQRQVAMYLAHRLTDHSLPTLGRLFGGRDHSTIQHGIRVIEQLIADGDPLAAVVEDLQEVLRVTADNGVLAAHELSDPLLVALQVARLGNRARPSLAEVSALAGAVIMAGVRAGDVTIAGEDPEPEDPELMPIVRMDRVVVEPDETLTQYRVLASGVVAAWRELQRCQYGRGEIGARRAFDAAIRALSDWTSAQEGLPC